MADFKITKIIEKKRNGEKLSDDDIDYFVDSVVKTTVQDEDVPKGMCIDRSQIGAMLMAIYLKDLDKDEMTELTVRMKSSGYVFSWPKEWAHLVVDKHSTGGVGDKVSLILAPALAAVGLKVPMISGRSLSHTGGTLDKLESIPGFRVLLTKEEIHNVISTTGCCIVGQTQDCAPADKVLYQCREITATVTCPPLIIASIVSKKLSEGTNSLVYDVKYGKGSVFSSKKEAIETAKNLVENSKGTRASALLTSMENPLGKAIGNSLEVLEAVECLRGRGPQDVIQLTCALGSELLHSARNTTRHEGELEILGALKDGRALKKFRDMIIHQGVSPEIAKELCDADAASVLPKTLHETEICHDGEKGYIEEIDPLALAEIWKDELSQSNNHLGVGLTLLKVAGEKIQKGEAWVKMNHQCDKITDETLSKLKNAIRIDKHQVKKVLIDKRLYLSDQSILMEEKYESKHFL